MSNNIENYVGRLFKPPVDQSLEITAEEHQRLLCARATRKEDKRDYACYGVMCRYCIFDSSNSKRFKQHYGWTK